MTRAVTDSPDMILVVAYMSLDFKHQSNQAEKRFTLFQSKFSGVMTPFSHLNLEPQQFCRYKTAFSAHFQFITFSYFKCKNL